MRMFEKSIEVNVPAEECYRIWSDFEDYPRFMPHLESVRRVDIDRHIYHFKAKDEADYPDGHEWDIHVDTLTPPGKIAWHSMGSAAMEHAMEVLLEDTGLDRSRVTLKLRLPEQGKVEFEPGIFQNPQSLLDEKLHHFVNLAERRTPYPHLKK